MGSKYSKNVYSSSIDDKTKERLIKKLSLECDSKEINRGILFKYKNSSISIFETNKILIQSKNVVGIVKELNLPFVKYEKDNFADSNQSNKNNELEEYIGCDEVGVGDYFGGIVCASVQVNKDNKQKLQSLHIDDSKKLSDEEINVLAPKIMKLCNFNVAAFTPAQYNDYYNSYPNVNTIKTICHNTNIVQMQKENIEKNKGHITVVMDQYCPPEKYLNHLKSLHQKIYPILQKVDIFETKAESKYIAVAAASILARYFFLLQIKDLIEFINKTAGLKLKYLPLGASNEFKIKKVIDMILDKTKDKAILRYLIKLNFKKI